MLPDKILKKGIKLSFDDDGLTGYAFYGK